MSFGAGDSSGGSVPQFKSFVSETELEERRRKRQEEWEKVRKPDQPLKAPEEEYDPRSLFERLEEQRMKRQADYEEAHRLKNMIRGLDDDEVTFLEFVDKRKLELESQRNKEDMQEIEEYRKAVTNLSEEALEIRRQEIKKALSTAQEASGSKKGKQNLLASVVKRKSSDNSSESSKRMRSDSEKDNGPTEAPDSESSLGAVQTSDSEDSSHPTMDKDDSTKRTVVAPIQSSLHCIGVLPGLGVYTDSSDSENSSNSEDSDFDLVGRRRSHNLNHQHSPRSSQ